MRAGGLAAVVLLVLFGASSGPASAARSSCAGKRVVTTQKVVVTKVRRSGGSGAAVTTFYACARPRGARAVLGRTGGGSPDYYGPHYALSKPLIVGSFVAALQITGIDDATSCSKYTQSPTCVPDYAVRVLDAKSRRLGSIPVDPSAGLLAVSNLGAAAWQVGGQSPGLYAAAFRRAARRVADGRVGATSVHFSGTTLSWTDSNGHAESTEIT
jgi:hypothetical protein